MRTLRRWLFNRGSWLSLEVPADLETGYESWQQWGDTLLLFCVGGEGAPYPYLVQLALLGEEPLLVADLPSFVQLLEQLAPIVSAYTQAEGLKQRQWEWQQRQERKAAKHRKKARR